MKILRRLFISQIFFAALISPFVLPAQVVTDGNQTGFPPFGSFHGSDLELVALNNGNLHIEIPMSKLPMRGGTYYTYKSVYDTPNWELTTFNPDQSTTVWFVNPTLSVTGWRTSQPFVFVDYVQTSFTCIHPSGVTPST